MTDTMRPAGMQEGDPAPSLVGLPNSDLRKESVSETCFMYDISSNDGPAALPSRHPVIGSVFSLWRRLRNRSNTHSHPDSAIKISAGLAFSEGCAIQSDRLQDFAR
jgi:hypothetical protein